LAVRVECGINMALVVRLQCRDNKKSAANANENAQQRCMFERSVKLNLSQSLEGARRPAVIIYSVLFTRTR